jgi:hypothetical protein
VRASFRRQHVRSHSVSSLVLWNVLASTTAGCAFGRSSGECEITSELTESDFNNAIEAALPKLPDDMAATKLTVRPGCARDKHCPPSVNAQLLSVEVTFKGSDRLGVIEIPRTTWEAGEFRYLPALYHP